jgi:hypothetical protein
VSHEPKVGAAGRDERDALFGHDVGSVPAVDGDHAAGTEDGR